LKTEFIAKFEEVNYISFHAEDLDDEFDIISHIDTIPFLAEKRMVVIKSLLSNKKNADLKAILAGHIKKVPESTVLVFYENNEDFDKRQSLFKCFKTDSKLEYFKKASIREIDKFITDFLTEKGMTIDSETISFLSSIWKDGDLWSLKNELEKLTMYLVGDERKEVRLDDIKKVVTISVQTKIFDLVDYIGKKETKLAVEGIENLLEYGENEIYILTMIVYHFRVMIMIKSLTYKEYTNDEIREELKLHPFVLNKALYQVKNYVLDELKGIYRELLEIEIGVKTGKIDAKLALSMFVAKVAK
jgi:DNA polymerase-3 subunit delta